MVGVATLLTVLSIFNGYIIRLREMIREQEAHLLIRGPSPMSLCGLDEIEAAVKKIGHVVEAAPFLEAPAMYGRFKYNPCYLRGIDPGREPKVTGLGKFTLRPAELDGILASLDESVNHEDAIRDLLERRDRKALSPEEVQFLFSPDWRREIFARENPPNLVAKFLVPPPAVVVGSALLTSRELSLGELVKILTLDPRTSQPAYGDFLVTGAFKTGNFEVDSKMFFIPLNRMQILLNTFDAALNEECCEGLRIALDDYRHAEPVRRQIHQVLSGLPAILGIRDIQVRTWEDVRKNFLQAVTIEKWINGFVVSLLNIFTACVVLLMLVLIVIEKTRDAGILLSMGATPWGVFSIFLWSGLFISGVGTVFGLVSGSIFIALINPIHEGIYHLTGFKLFDPEVYLMDRIPTAISPGDIAFTILPAIGFGLLASLIPALWASRKDPIKSIQYE
ncbi:MAG: ABC transporter permease [Planctomycetes bacterium]|nr:ABC transporter permease [Planctomycetota bacterium]